MKKFNKIIYFLKNPILTKLLLSMAFNGYLYETGWKLSFLEKRPVDKNGNPLPWLSIPFISFIQTKINHNLVVFEYGSGSSTLFFAERAKQVLTVEHDEEWLSNIGSKVPSNARIYFCPLDYNSKYCRYISKFEKKFNLIIVDGRDRVNCIINSLSSLTSDGCIVLDDSEREYYQVGIQFLLDKNFRKIDFWGMSLGSYKEKCTTVFYRDNNCLNI